MQVDVITIFPKMFAPVVGESILKRAQECGAVRIDVHDLRSYTHDKRKTVDDRPYGGGPGMVLKPEPVFEAVEAVEMKRHGRAKAAAKLSFAKASEQRRRECEIILMSPGGIRLTQTVAAQLSRLTHLMILCGHYEGVDERIRQALVDREVSIGDYVLTGGELPAMVLIDTVVRLIPGVVGHPQSTHDESFAKDLLEYPHYTRPPVFRGMAVPEALRCGDHQRVATWRSLQAVARTSRQ
ncbi:MAG: tRNA (guanosine(37)-N1)-methyltransferase TrmD, partial [Candidatus Omnitrophica bacterium]|nr:tRNA (guanosine(37)-N1)-methyltransferase TrmD [Candidatus Omnitrophota bacterium]